MAVPARDGINSHRMSMTIQIRIASQTIAWQKQVTTVETRVWTKANRGVIPLQVYDGRDVQLRTAITTVWMGIHSHMNDNSLLSPPFSKKSRDHVLLPVRASVRFVSGL